MSIKYLLEQRITTMLQQVSTIKLLGLNYFIQYKKKVENKVNDALSQRDNDNLRDHLTTISTIIPTCALEVLDDFKGDSFVERLITQLSPRPNCKSYYQLKAGILRYQGKLVIGFSEEIRGKLIRECHITMVGRHQEFEALMSALRNDFFSQERKRMQSIGCKHVKFIKGAKQKRWLCQVYCNTFPCQIRHDLISAWISSKNFQNQAIRTQSWWWQIDSPQMITSKHSNIPLLLSKQLNYFSTTYTNCMAPKSNHMRQRQNFYHPILERVNKVNKNTMYYSSSYDPKLTNRPRDRINKRLSQVYGPSQYLILAKWISL